MTMLPARPRTITQRGIAAATSTAPAGASPVATAAEEEEWAPADGIERTLYTSLATTVIGRRLRAGAARRHDARRRADRRAHGPGLRRRRLHRGGARAGARAAAGNSRQRRRGARRAADLVVLRRRRRRRSASPGCCSTKNVVAADRRGRADRAAAHRRRAASAGIRVHGAGRARRPLRRDVARRDRDLLGGARLRIRAPSTSGSPAADEGGTRARARRRALGQERVRRTAGRRERPRRRSTSRPPTPATRRWRSASPSIARAAATAGGRSRRPTDLEERSSARRARGGRCWSIA